MPEGKLRSGVYRSFIMCDDPRGVVECGAIKKQSKSRSCICNQRFDHPWKAKERSEMAPRKSTEDAPSSSLQLLRVSEGIQKLNVAIDSWSKGSSYETVDIAKGLLRGALDLEESLAMLQEDDIKQKPRDLRFQRSMSDRFGERIEKRMMVQENVASKDCYEELRKVIRESFLRQNLIPQTTTTRVVRSDSVAASSSTSSSQSSMVTGSTKSSASSDITRRAPSLIARLMGLDVSHQEQNHIDKLKLKKESPETMRCNSTREAVLQSLPKKIPSENPSSTIVLIRPMNIVEKPEKKGPKKPRMQGEVHPRMINQRKDHQAKGASKKSSNEMKLTKKDREPKGMVCRIQENEGKPVETNKKISVKKEDIGEGKERFRPHDPALKPPTNHATHKNRRSRLSSSASSSDEQKSNSREKKSGEASRPSAKKKLHPRGNDIASENISSSSHESITQHSAEETTCTEFHIQGQCDKGQVSSCPVTIHPETSQISLKSFLSNSSNFISYAANLVDFNTNTKRSQETTYQDNYSIVISDQRLALDFAKEVAKRRSLLLITEPTCPQRSSVHIDELLMEVCDGFESLRSYRDTFLGQSSFVKESIHMVLDKDLNSKKTEMASGVWDLGWRSEFQIYETHQAVVDLEKLILSGLIQEILS